MRPLVFMTALVALVAAGAAAAPNALQAPKLASGATFVLTGRGWGHGVGMSQCGALGYGQHGWRYARIVGHYYPGTQLTDAPVSRVRVLLADGRRSVRI